MSQLKHFPLPDVGEGLTEAEVLTWHVSPGDTVQQNQSIVEIETAKASVELPCPFPGQVTELLAEVGQTVEVGSPIITIDLDPDGSAPSAPDSAESTSDSSVESESSQESASSQVSAQSAGSAESGPGDAPETRSSEEVANLVGYGPRSTSTKRRPRRDAPDSDAGTSTSDSSGSGKVNGVVTPARSSEPTGAAAESSTSASTAVSASEASSSTTAAATAGRGVPLAKPPVRKLAKDSGVDLNEVRGSGAGGVITREDVERAASSGPEQTAAAASTEQTTVEESTRERRVPIRGVRRATAQAMVDSAFTAPHVTEFLTVDVTPMMQLRERLKTDPRFAGVKVTPLAFAAKALCLAVRRTPDANATWDEAAGEIVYKDYVHLGVAAATPRGLVVPKVRDADRMSLSELAEALESLTATAREGRTSPEDMVGGTITLTNVGVFGVDSGTPILNPGESAIFALGAIREMPWVVDGQVVPRQVCQLALSFDHRVVDGQQGSQLLADIGALLSDPATAITF